LEKIKVGIVNYLNAKPLVYGIERAAIMDRIELVQEYPAAVARMLAEGSIDIGLAPVALLHRMPHFRLVTDYCIGCNGPIASVCLFSEVPIEEVTEVLLDYQSRTSVALAKILLREYWQLQPVLTDTRDDFRARIKGNTAAVLIGDRALQQRHISPYIYDLGEAWKAHTGLPFMFAGWISNKELPADFIAAFNEANRDGLNYIDTVAGMYPFPHFDLQQYYTKYVDYIVDAEKKKAVELFLQKINNKVVIK